MKSEQKEQKLAVPQKAFTHGGKFHADDVFGAALLRCLNPDIEIQRGFEIPQDFDGLVFDIGFGRFDHHQSDAPVRANGVPYGAFGLLFEEFGEQVLSPQDAQEFDERFIQPLDLTDNTGCDHPLADVINLYNPNWNEQIDRDQRFQEAVELAEGILKKYFTKIDSMNQAAGLVRVDLQQARDRILFLHHFVPWKKALRGTDMEYVVYCSQRGGFCAQAVSREDGQMKRPFPQAWRGLEGEALEEVSGVCGLRFCHKSGFLLTGDSADTVMKACKIVQTIQNPEKKNA